VGGAEGWSCGQIELGRATRSPLGGVCTARLHPHPPLQV